jgi:Coenzyme PQQ synthesis protein D (PqqD)
MTMIKTDSTPRPTPEAVHRNLSEGAVVLHLGSGQYHGLNPIGALIWELLDGERTVEEIAALVREQVDGAPAELRSEVASFIDGLRERGLVVA